MINTNTSRTLTGAAIFGFAMVLLLSVPQHAHAWGGYNNGGYNGGYVSHSYPPAPNFYTIPSVQVVYSNGYYQNYFVPTVRYFPAVNPLPVPTTYYPTQPPAYTYPGVNNFPGNYGGYYHNW